MADDEANSIDETLPPVAPAGTDEADSSAADSKLIIGGRYVVEREVGRGGVGEVYLARHQFTGQPVAIKTLRSKWADNDSAIARFEREAKALSQLQHPNCVGVLDFGREGPEGDWYLAMEWVEGEDFKQLIRRSGPLEAGDWVDYFKQALKALRYIHESGILHRDIKPKNLMLTEKQGAAGVVKLVDFGFAKMTSENEKDAKEKKLTKPGTVLGTPEYMAPEQAKGEVIDSRADLFALSSVMLYCLTGRSFFRGDGIRETLTNVIRRELPPIQQLVPEKWCSEELDAFLRKALAKKRVERYQSAQEMLDALNRLPLKKPEIKNPWQYTDPTSQFHRRGLSEAGGGMGVNGTSDAFDSLSQEAAGPKAAKFLIGGLAAMTVVFGAMTWLLVQSGDAETGAFGDTESMERTQDAPKPAHLAPSGPQKERLFLAKEAMAKQDFSEAQRYFEVLEQEGVWTREVLKGLAISSFHLKDYQKAAQGFKKLMRHFPKEAAKYRPFMQMATKKAEASATKD